MLCVVGVSDKGDEHTVGDDRIGLRRLLRSRKRYLDAAFCRRTVIDGHIVALIEVEAVERERVRAGTLGGHHPRAVGIGSIGTHGLRTVGHIAEAGSIALMSLTMRRFNGKRRPDFH